MIDSDEEGFSPEQLCGFDVSSTEVSRCAELLDDELTAWRQRPLGAYPFVVLDGRYEKMRHGGTIVDCAVLLAMGVDADGRREVLGTSDDHSGLKAARAAVFPSVPWQRCQFHLQQNAGHYVPRKAMRKTVAADIRAIFQAPDHDEAKRPLQRFIETYKDSAPQLAAWAETALPEGLTVLALSLTPQQQRRLRTSNAIERVNKEIHRRTRVATLFPNEASCLRLVTAVAMEISQDWQTGRRYLNMNEDEDE